MSSKGKEILNWVNEVEKFQKKDPKCRNLMTSIKDLGNRMMYVYGKIHNEEYENQDEFNLLNFEISKIAQEKREAEKEYKDLVEDRFADFKEKYEKIFELAISEEGIDKNTLNHVIKTYDQYTKQQINHNQGTNIGLKYMQQKFQMPENFFTYLPENDDSKTLGTVLQDEIDNDFNSSLK